MPTKTPKPRRDEILDAATRLFAERGYEGVSVHDVAERVGIGKASLFHHFATKDVLYEAVLDRMVVGLQEPLAAIYASSGSFAERLDVLTATLTRALGAQPYAARLLVRETMDWGPVMRSKLADRIVLVLEAGAAWVQAGQADGVFVEGDARHLILSVLGMHLLPFAIDRLVERYVGTSPFKAPYIAARADALQRQARRLHLKK